MFLVSGFYRRFHNILLWASSWSLFHRLSKDFLKFQFVWDSPLQIPGTCDRYFCTKLAKIFWFVTYTHCIYKIKIKQERKFVKDFYILSFLNDALNRCSKLRCTLSEIWSARKVISLNKNWSHKSIYFNVEFNTGGQSWVISIRLSSW